MAARWRSVVRPGFFLVFAALGLAPAPPAAADPIKTIVAASVAEGYARLLFDLHDYDDASIRQAGNVLIISFKTPIDVSVDRLAAQAPGYIGAARLDPDGKAVRLALSRPVKVNMLTAGEKLFVDLLPDNWQGLPPGLPQTVVEELARRARQAELRAAHEQIVAKGRQMGPVRVHIATQPTFTRYVFSVPEQISVAADHADGRLTLSFDAPLHFDLRDVESALPPGIASITAEIEDGSSSVRFGFRSKLDVRTFRDENGYVVDVVGANSAPPAVAVPTLSAPVTVSPGQTPPAAASPVLSAPSAAAPAAATPGAADKPPAAAETSPAAPGAAAPADPVAAAVAQLEAQAPPKSTAQPLPQAEPQAQPPAGVAAPNPAPAASITPPAAAAPLKTEAPAIAAKPVPEKAAAPAIAAKPVPEKAAAPAIAAKPAPPTHDPNGKVPVELARNGVNIKISFDFASPTAAAVFHRADTLWIVFDSKADIDLGVLDGEATRTIRSAALIRAPDADIVRIKLDRPHLSSVSVDGTAWTVEIGDTVLDPSHALDLTRNLVGPNHSTISIPFEAPHELHRIADPEAGDQLLVVTAFGPPRGLINAQDFIEFHALASEQGVVVQPLADDLNVGLAPDKVVISRPRGLTLSSSLQSLLRGSGLRPQTFDSQLWGYDRRGSYVERQSQLIAAAAAASPEKRLRQRLDLARFYLAREMYPEAKGVLDVVLAERRAASEDVTAIIMRAVAEIMMNRPQEALQDLANPAVGQQHDAPLWRALAYARQGKWAQAREGFKTVEAAIATLPIELQRIALKDEMRAAVEVHDYGGAENELNDLETIGVPREMQPAVSVLIGRLDQGLGRAEDALAAYRTAADSWDRPAAAQGRLRETELRYSLGDLKSAEVVSDLESLTTVWRGDETEIQALQLLARLYTGEGRYRDSFYVMRSAMAAHPDWDMTRKIQEEAAKTFDSLFLDGKGDTLSAVDALALFYDFRELTPIGSRGDEMIRRLADRLVAVDLLDQAAGLLQYQVDNRLQGAARAEVSTRLAVIYLMNRKPDRALATLQATRMADLSTELRSQRLLLEARALSDLGRHDLALEVIASMKTGVAMRLRSDIYWSAQRWRKAAEQIELMYGDRFKQWQPLSVVERSDVLRAEIGYALAEDSLGLQRFRDKYAAKMEGTPDARAFEVVSAPLGTGGEDFKNIAHAAAAADTLDDFLRDMKEHYRESNPLSEPRAAAAPPPGATPPAGQPAAEKTPPPGAVPPQTEPPQGSSPTPGSASAPAARTAQR